MSVTAAFAQQTQLRILQADLLLGRNVGVQRPQDLKTLADALHEAGLPE